MLTFSIFYENGMPPPQKSSFGKKLMIGAGLAGAGYLGGHIHSNIKHGETLVKLGDRDPHFRQGLFNTGLINSNNAGKLSNIPGLSSEYKQQLNNMSQSSNMGGSSLSSNSGSDSSSHMDTGSNSN